MVAYHDREWGRPVHDDRILFEFLTLEGAQAGLSWSTILRKREGYRRAFASFDPAKVARFDKARIRPAAAFYHSDLHEFVLPYDEVREAPSPDAILLEFLQSSYDAAADLGKWDRAALE